MKTYLIISEREWNKSLIERLQDEQTNWLLINKREDFTFENLKNINPSKIFIPHWSYYIPEEIFLNFECVVFHETDLPFGRGGSPIQNLIERQFLATKVSAIRVSKEIDAGDIYLKKEMSLLGTAEEIFIRINKIVELMIREIVELDLKPYPQEGSPTFFKRRNQSQSDINSLTELDRVFDYIRMLDAEGYPKAFLETDNLRMEFTRASLKADESIYADVKITLKK